MPSFSSLSLSGKGKNITKKIPITFGPRPSWWPLLLRDERISEAALFLLITLFLLSLLVRLLGALFPGFTAGARFLPFCKGCVSRLSRSVLFSSIAPAFHSFASSQ